MKWRQLLTITEFKLPHLKKKKKLKGLETDCLIAKEYHKLYVFQGNFEFLIPLPQPIRCIVPSFGFDHYTHLEY